MSVKGLVGDKILLTTSRVLWVYTWLLLAMISGSYYITVCASPDLPRLFKSSLRSTNEELFPWGIYITPDDTILRYFKGSPVVGELELTIQSCIENHFFKTPSLRDSQTKPVSPGERFLVRQQLSDVYLASFLSACCKLTCDDTTELRSPTCGQQYLAHLAPAQLELEGTYNLTQIELWLTLVGRYSRKVSLVFGFSVPVRNIQRSLTGRLLGGRSVRKKKM